MAGLFCIMWVTNKSLTPLWAQHASIGQILTGGIILFIYLFIICQRQSIKNKSASKYARFSRHLLYWNPDVCGADSFRWFEHVNEMDSLETPGTDQTRWGFRFWHCITRTAGSGTRSKARSLKMGLQAGFKIDIDGGSLTYECVTGTCSVKHFE